MVAPYIRVLKGRNTAFWIEKFLDIGVEVGVDMVHDCSWFKKELDNEENAFIFEKGCFYNVHEKDWEHDDVGFLMICQKDDLLWLMENFVIPDVCECREQMREYFMKGFVTERLVHDVEPVISMAPEKMNVDQPYRFRCHYYEGYDVKLFEVVRPGTEKPFTVLVDCFSKRSDEYFFTDIYGSSSWDCNRLECRYDFLFLQNLWNHLGLEGSFTMDVLKKRVDRCYPGEGRIAESEPIVYRVCLEDVEKLMNERRIYKE